MSTDEHHENDPLQSLIADILEAEGRGESVDRDAILNDHPKHAESLREFFADHDRMKSAAEIDPPTLPPKSGGHASDDLSSSPLTCPIDDPTLPPTAPSGDEPTLPPTEGASKPGEPTVGDKVRYFGDYELLEEIARGGMGVVYKARQINLNRVVALKMILAGQFAGEEDVQRFYTEAEAAAQLDHPGIVPIFEIGEHQGQHYFSMGFVEGESLAHEVADGPLPPHEVAELVKKICDAMAYAHERGVIHRDLKPANILIDQNGKPKVTDFGLAKKTEADSNLTGTGQILGTPAYMPPEQASGKTDVGPLADVYSLGAILYCLLTGRPPFQAASPMDTLLQVLDKEPVGLRELNPEVPRDLDTICLKCLNKESPRRYGSAQALGADLGRYLAGEPILARPTTRAERAWKWCKRNPRAVATASFVTLLLIAVGIVMSLQQRKNVAQRARTTVASLNSTRGVILPPLSNLDEFSRELVVDELQSQFVDATDRKLPLAFALAYYGDVRIAYLLSQVEDAPPDEAANFVDALARAKSEALEAIKVEFSPQDESDNSILRHRARLAMLALQLGDPKLAIDLCQLEADPSARTVFIDECSSWSGNLIRLSDLAREIDDAQLRSALCLAVGGVSPNHVTTEQREAWRTLLTDWHGREPDSGTHSASHWALKNWGLSVPKVPSVDSDSDHQWRINSVGLTLLTIPRANDRADDAEVVARTDRFRLSDQEISVGMFRQFIDDPDYPTTEKPTDWNRKSLHDDVSLTGDQPVVVSWYDAVLFCNWLSRREGRAPCYERTGEKDEEAPGVRTEYDAWRLVPASNGYRLPTEAEWEYACRARTTTLWSFGDDREWMKDYGVSNQVDRAEPCRTKLPNGWGLFDMYGNALEWCNDSNGFTRAVRGGSWRNSASLCQSSTRAWEFPSSGSGFRVVAVESESGSPVSSFEVTDETRSSVVGKTGDRSRAEHLATPSDFNFNERSRFSFADITDKTKDRLIAGTVQASRAVPWTKPDDIIVDDRFQIGGNSFSDGHVMHAHGGVRYLSIRDDMNKATLKALFRFTDDEVDLREIVFSTKQPRSDWRAAQDYLASAKAQMQASDSLKKISIALHNYDRVHKRLPPAITYGPDGRPWHSWRVLILPYVGRSDLYRRYDQSVPWDDPKNAAVLNEMPDIYRYPGSDSSTLTRFLAATGEGTAFPIANQDELRERSIREAGRVVEQRRNHWDTPAQFSLFVARGPYSNRYKVDDLSRMIRSLIEAGEKEQAFLILDRIVEIAESEASASIKASAFANVAHAMTQTGLPDRAREYVQRALESIQGTKFPARSSILTTIAIETDRVGEREQAMTILMQAAIAAQETDLYSRTKYLSSIAVAMDTMGEKAQVIQTLNQAAQFAQEIEKPWSKSTALSDIAVTAATTGEKTQALHYLSLALDVAHTIDDALVKASALRHVAACSLDVGDKKRARDLLSLAEIAASQISDTTAPSEPANIRAEVLTKIGSCWINVGDKKQASNVLLQALESAKAIEAPRSKRSALTSIASAYAKLDDKEQCIRVLLDALEVKTQADTNTNFYSSRDLTLIASVFLEIGEEEQAMPVLRQALTTARGIENRILWAGSLRQIAYVWLTEWDSAPDSEMHDFKRSKTKFTAEEREFARQLVEAMFRKK